MSALASINGSTTMRAVGDCAVVEIGPAGDDTGVVKLCSRHGLVRAWSGARVAASLADPPRLALRLSGGSVVVVDPGTGDIARAVDEALGIAWFSPKNGLLCGFDARGLVRVEAAREKRVRRVRPPRPGAARSVVEATARLEARVASIRAGSDHGPVAPPIVDVCVSPSGKLLLGRVAFVPGNVVACIDAVHDRLEWSRDVSAGAPVVLAVARGSVLVAAINVEGVTIELRDLTDGRPRGTPLRLARVREEPDSFRAIFARAVGSTVSVALMRKGGQVSRHVIDVVDGGAWRTIVDDRVGVALDDDGARPGPLTFARLDTGHGSVVIDATRATASCFTPRGVAVALAKGVAHTLEICDGSAASSAHVVPGPTNLVAIAPHPRGVVALDADDRAHVLAIDDDARDAHDERDVRDAHGERDVRDERDVAPDDEASS